MADARSVIWRAPAAADWAPAALVVGAEDVVPLLPGLGLRVGSCDALGALLGHLSVGPSLVVLGGTDATEDACRGVREARFGGPLLVLIDPLDAERLVRLLDAGADDAVIRPFAEREVEARVAALLRRAAMRAQFAAVDVGPLRFDGGVVELDGRPIPFTEKEYAFLAMLARAQGRVVSRQDLVKRIWGDARISSETDSLNVLVYRVRSKLGQFRQVVEAVGRSGYRLRGDDR